MQRTSEFLREHNEIAFATTAKAISWRFDVERFNQYNEKDICNRPRSRAFVRLHKEQHY